MFIVSSATVGRVLFYQVCSLFVCSHNYSNSYVLFSRIIGEQVACLLQKIVISLFSVGTAPYHAIFSARCNIYISRLCYHVSVHLSMTEVHWHIIANLGFKFRSHFTMHCLRAARAMLASARSLVYICICLWNLWRHETLHICYTVWS